MLPLRRICCIRRVLHTRNAAYMVHATYVICRRHLLHRLYSTPAPSWPQSSQQCQAGGYTCRPGANGQLCKLEATTADELGGVTLAHIRPMDRRWPIYGLWIAVDRAGVGSRGAVVKVVGCVLGTMVAG